MALWVCHAQPSAGERTLSARSQERFRAILNAKTQRDKDAKQLSETRSLPIETDHWY